ncbi:MULTISPECIES: ATP-binding protein [unclassified Mucilaginibacter]|uniref:HAMP domain-containing sensor histidine kinase n=1 Tax=unclassified Mucilaginibacter TaxID=2617802 RepID=UPI002AC8E05A|nr:MULTISPECIES: ATP-binding protein [unclassified Mucilaginibacter]MEB0264027.1 ATP-binding protein [Mucilaginibacter sp. 10I4]MEB0280642.1 ATP-binding protein [Mucilaginibacter sp. 10B2]MEB0303091.1 ATP-binding protein [Mucilaginibacter sp. 5C4]WPX24258.1 ATP-binding protein [Mucilaginibacter sp. 5C4]
MKVKNKLRLGFGFLFLVVLAFGLLSLIFINRLSTGAKVILQDNYNSLSFTREMRSVLDENKLPLNAAALRSFEKQLIAEEHNITEPGERQAATALRNAFVNLRQKTDLKDLQQAELEARRSLRQVEIVNMRAITNKNAKANSSVDEATLVLALVGTFTFLVLFSFSVNFPGIISGPLNALLVGIREISQQNYNKRIHFTQNDEFAEVAGAFNDMATRLNEWQNSNLSTVMSDKLRIETIIEQMQDAILGIDEKQEILFINTSAKKILNISEPKMEGRSVADIIKSNELFKSIVDGQQTGKPFKIVVEGQNSHFQLETREINVPNIGPDSGPVIIANKSAGKVYILKNITEFKERDEAKTNFIATISHELKTPISAIKMSLKLLVDPRVGVLNKEQEQLAKHIEEDSERLLKINSELLDLSQVETGNIQLNFVASNPDKIVDYAIKAVRFEAEQKGVTIEYSIPENLPEVNADVEKTAWVLINFLSNALRYSPAKSKIELNLSLKGQYIEFSVRDFGKGVDPVYQKRLFDRYFQVPTDGQNKSGSGLGLAISKDFIEAQGGSIGLESEVGEGSRFYFNLPVTKA